MMIALQMYFLSDGSNVEFADSLYSNIDDWAFAISDQFSSINEFTTAQGSIPGGPYVDQLNITESPTLVFIDQTNNQVITRIKGSAINKNNVQSILMAIDAGRYDEATSMFLMADGSPFGPEGFGNGMGLFSTKNICAFFAGLSAYKAITSENKIPWSLATAGFGYKYSKL